MSCIISVSLHSTRHADRFVKLLFPSPHERSPERRREHTAITRLLASGHSQLHAKEKGAETPSDALARGRAADEVVSPPDLALISVV